MFNRPVRFLAGILLSVVVVAGEAALAFTTSPVIADLDNPIFLTHAGDSSGRLFVVEQPGVIRIIKDGSVLPNPFLDIHTRVASGGERGLLGLAFHPDFASNGFFYVNYTASSPLGQTTVSRFSVSTFNPDLADPGSEVPVLTQTQPASNHNGGMIAFGPDGYLYIGLGDGGGAGDPSNYAQTPTTFLGKMLRLDVDGGSPYAIPPDNPFVGSPGVLGEIWALGLRNPWRWSFDRETGDLWIGDVGQGTWEEIDFQPASSSGGHNYGWRLKEGYHCYNPSSGCDPGGALDDPVYEYDHDFGCSVTGGYVYRGCAVAALVGKYIFGDYCSGTVWALTQQGGTVTSVDNITSDIGGAMFGLVSFGEDELGELYLVYHNGSILKIIPEAGENGCEPCCEGPSRGNVDNSPDNQVTMGDLTVMIDHLFISYAPLLCIDEGNVDASPAREITMGDLTVLIDHLFISYSPLPACP